MALRGKVFIIYWGWAVLTLPSHDPRAENANHLVMTYLEPRARGYVKHSYEENKRNLFTCESLSYVLLEQFIHGCDSITSVCFRPCWRILSTFLMSSLVPTYSCLYSVESWICYNKKCYVYENCVEYWNRQNTSISLRSLYSEVSVKSFKRCINCMFIGREEGVLVGHSWHQGREVPGWGMLG